MISEFPKCTHVTGKHTIKIAEEHERKPLGPTLICIECGEKFYMLSETQIEEIQETGQIQFIPPAKYN